MPSSVPVPINNANDLLNALADNNVTYLSLQNNISLPANTVLVSNGDKIITNSDNYQITIQRL